MNSADLVTPDGMPLVWGLRKLGVQDASRVYGPDLTPAILSAAEEQGIPVGFFGGASDVLAVLLKIVAQRWPRLEVVYSYSPPFRALTPDEDQAIADEINSSGARILLVGIGCPKQENWMARHKGRIECVSVGVGAAFDFITGIKKQAPLAMQRSGTEWLYRLLSEPRRLWKRYLLHNPRFMALFGVQLVRQRTGTP
jgi:N-acetylglucosaminyldiphosphoundecaprenol N-acetyl-beta-D-mannosaminyltransferase